MVRFLDAFRYIWGTCQLEWKKDKVSKGFFQEMINNISLDSRDFACILFIGIVITVIRREVNRRLLQVNLLTDSLITC